MEVWKDIKNYEGLYQVSNEGRVKSLPRTWIGGKGCVRHNDEKLMEQHPIWNDYLRVCLSKNGTNKWYLVHRLVAEAFIDNPDNLPQVNHKNEQKQENFVENLEWCSKEYNLKYGTRTTRTSKPVEALDDEGNVVYTFESKREARRQGFADANISNCIKGKIEKAYGLRWRQKKAR